MKRKIFLICLMAIAFVCIFAFSVFASTPDTSKKTVVLSDGTVLPIWDADGDALIWYKSTANTDDGYASYDYVKAQSSEVDYKTSWAGNINGVTANQVGTITITVNGTSYGKNDIVVFNINDEDVLVTTSAHGKVGQPVNCISGVFKQSTSLEYAFLRFDTTAIQGDAFHSASKLKYVNFEELTELTQIVAQNFSNCSSLLDGQTLDLSNTKLITLQSGTFNNTPIGAIIFPETLVNLNSWSLQGLLKIKEIHIPEGIVSFGDTMFKNCYELETITGYKALFERGVISTIQGSTFLDCRSLKNVDLPESFTSIGGAAFRGTASLSGTFKIPNECEEIGDAVFHGSGFETIILSANMTSVPIYTFCQSYVKTIYMPEGITSIGREAFRDVKNKVVVYYTGTDTELLKSVTVNNYNGVILDNSTVYTSADMFDLENKEDKHYVVFGYDKCEAFYGGHQWKGENNVIFEDYFKSIGIGDTCKNCNGSNVKSTIAPIFEWKGYSKSTFGDTYSVVQGFYVNREALNDYLVYAPDFDFGIMATGNASGEAIKPQIGADKVFTAIFDNTASDYYDVKVTGITEAQKALNVVFCIYVLDGGKMYYLDGGNTAEDVIGISHENIQ